MKHWNKLTQMITTLLILFDDGKQNISTLLIVSDNSLHRHDCSSQRLMLLILCRPYHVLCQLPVSRCRHARIIVSKNPISVLCVRFQCNSFSLQRFDTVVGWHERHPACKKLDVSSLVVMIWLELCTTYSSGCHHHFHHPLLH